MNSELWSTVREARLGAPGAVAEFVEIVDDRLKSNAALGPASIQKLFSHLSRHIGVLRRGDDFDGWLETQVKRLGLPDVAEEGAGNGERREVARAAFREGLESKVPFLGTRGRVGRLVFNGWLPFFLIALSFLLYLWPHGEESWNKSTEANLLSLFWFSLLWPTLLSFVLSPSLGAWRQQVARSPGRATMAALFFTFGFFFFAGFLIWLGAEGRLSDLVATWKNLGTPYLLVELWERYCGAFSDRPYCLGMDTPLMMTLLAAIFMVWLAAVYAHYSFWIPMTEIRPWRLKLSRGSLIMGPVAILIVTLSTLNCCVFDRELQAHWSRPTMPESKVDDDPRLLQAFEADPRVRAFAGDINEQYTDNRRSQPVFQAWLDAGSHLWSQEKWYESPELKPLAESYVFGQALSKPQEAPSYTELEARLRSWCVERDTSNESTLTMLEQAKLTANQWRRLEDISLQGLEFIQQSQRQDFDRGEMLEFAPSSDALSLMQRIEQRIVAGSRWKLYKKYREDLRQAKVMTPDELRRFCSRDRGLNAPGVFRRVMQDRAAFHQALIVILCEARRLKAEGQPSPHSMEELRPEIEEHLKPYSDWLYLKKTGTVISVGIYSYQQDASGKRTEFLSVVL